MHTIASMSHNSVHFTVNGESLTQLNFRNLLEKRESFSYESFASIK